MLLIALQTKLTTAQQYKIMSCYMMITLCCLFSLPSPRFPRCRQGQSSRLQRSRSELRPSLTASSPESGNLQCLGMWRSGRGSSTEGGGCRMISTDKLTALDRIVFLTLRSIELLNMAAVASFNSFQAGPPSSSGK